MTDAQTFEAINDLIDATAQTKDGQQIQIRLRKLPIREMNSLGMAWGREVAELGVYCRNTMGKPLEDSFFDHLSDESWAALIEEGRRINFPRFTAFYHRQQKAMEALQAGNGTMAKPVTG